MDYVLHLLTLTAIFAILTIALNLLLGYTGLFSLASGAYYGIGAYTAALLALALALRAAEARGASGGAALGHALLHAFMVLQVSVAIDLLELPGFIGPVVILLAFYAWGGAADDLYAGASRLRVAVEYGSLALLGLLVALLMRGA